MKRPAFQFYPADWRKDAALQSCSLAARGLWADMMCVMHECEPYGHLVVNARAMTTAQIARLVGVTERECAKLLHELESAGVFSRDVTGIIFSRRMVKDERLRNVRAESGRLGGNPNLVNHRANQTSNQPGNHSNKQRPTPSSSSSSSSSTSVRNSGGRSELPTSAAPPLPGTLSPPTWTAWRAHLANLGKPLTPQAERLQLARLAGHADADAIVRKAIESGHRNLEPVGGYPDAKRNPTVHAKRAATAAAIYGTPPEPPNVEPTDITGEASRIA